MFSEIDVDSLEENETKDYFLKVEIADALSEKEKVIFTIRTNTTFPEFKSKEMTVSRTHDEFVWLHEELSDNHEYAGLILPPVPPRPDFDSCRDKLLRLMESDTSLTEDELTKMKKELEAEYLALFKKTVAMHDVFLKRVASHSILKKSLYLRIFLEFDKDLCVKLKSKRKKITEQLQKSMNDKLNLFSNTTSTNSNDFNPLHNSAVTNESNSTMLDENDSELNESRNSLIDYRNAIKSALINADNMNKWRRDMASQIFFLSAALQAFKNTDVLHFNKFFRCMDFFFEKYRVAENRIASDQDLKLSDSLRYYSQETDATLDLLARRQRALQTCLNCNKNIEKSKSKQRSDLIESERLASEAIQKLNSITNSAKSEIKDFRNRRIVYMRKSIVELAEFEIKNNKNQLILIKQTLSDLKSL